MGSHLRKPGKKVQGLRVRESHASDVALFAPRLRIADRAEIEAAGLSVGESLSEGFAGKSCYTAFIHGQPAAIFGLFDHKVSDGLTVGTIWMLGTDMIEAYPKIFLRAMRRWLPLVCEDCDVVMNAVHVENEVHIHFLQHLGFTFMYESMIGDFIPFFEEVKNVCR